MTDQSDEFTERLQETAPSLSRTMRRIAAFLDNKRADVLSMSAVQLARELGTSDASIVRTARALGYDGLPALRRSIARSLSPGPTEGFRQTLAESSADAVKAAEQTIDAHRRQMALISDDALSSLHAIARMLNECERTVLFGIGPTAHIVRYGAQLLCRHGRTAFAVDQTGRSLADQLLALRKGDGVLIFAYGSPYVEAEVTAEEAIRLSLPTALVTDSPRNRLSRLMEQVVVVPRAEARGMSLHGTTMVWLEALIVSLSVMSRDRTVSELERLESLRGKVSQQSTETDAPIRQPRA